MKKQTKDSINVIIVDDGMVYRTAVKTVLSFKKDIRVIAEADNGFQLLLLLKTIQLPDIILLDIQMPVMNGIAALPELKKWYPTIKVIMLTMIEDHSMITKLTNLGANGYLSKTSNPQIIYEAIKICHERDFYNSSLTDKALHYNLYKDVSSYIKVYHEDTILSKKEFTVLRLICEGRSILEISESIGLSLHKLEAIRNKLKTKAGVNSKTRLVKFAVKNRLLNHSD